MSSSSTTANVAVIGGTGALGEQISTILLTEYRSSFPTVRVITRDPSSPKAQQLAQKGAELFALDGSLESAFTGVDVVINLLPPSIPHDVRKKITEAALKNSPKVYFLSDFGIDHRLTDFPGYNLPDWESKQQLAKETRALAQGKTKVIAVYNGLFLEILLAPYRKSCLGFDLEHNIFTPYGPASQRFAVTSKADIGRAVARLALLALDPTTSAQVPDEVRIAGSIVTFEGVRDLYAQVKGLPKGQIKSEDLAQKKEGLRQNKDSSILEYLRVLLGENKFDFTDNSNELINPGQKLWKWRTVEDQIRAL
ncbi:hypothetical protein BD413DRAFT_477275 [Trametes elegans]|nr:hypothetical protein BD413DRAFT_477275 [Trametes elegans]